MNIPILSSITDLITGALTDDFKKLFKASALVASAIFLTLNLVLILPPLREAGVSPVVALDRMTTAWQIALGTLLLFVLAYVIDTLGAFFVNLASGTSFKDSPVIGSLLLVCQRKIYKGYRRVLDPDEEGYDKASRKPRDTSEAAERLSYSFPSKGALAPTRLGNVLASTAGYTWHKYGANLNVLWPLMEMVLGEKDTGLRDQVNENRSALTFLSSLAVLLALIGAELVVVQLVLGPPLQALWALLIWAVGYVVYGAAVQKGQAWGRNVRTAFDLYLGEIPGKLGLAKLDKERWQRVSNWLGLGGIEPDVSEPWGLGPDRSWYEQPAAAGEPQLQHPSTIEVRRGAVTPVQGEATRDDAEVWHFKPTAHYTYVISNIDTGEHAKAVDGAFLIVTDERWPSIAEKVSGTVFVPNPPPRSAAKIPVTGERQGSSRSLLWHVGALQPRCSRVLHYTVAGSPYVSASTTSTKFEIKALWEMQAEADPQVLLKLEAKENTMSSGTLTVAVELPTDAEEPTVEYKVVDAQGKGAFATSAKATWTEADRKLTCPVEVKPDTTQVVIRITRWGV